jgi:mono/diheme cytochrome c family protein
LFAESRASPLAKRANDVYIQIIVATNKEPTMRVHPIFAVALTLSVSTAVLAEPAIFKGADIKLGKQLIEENNCAACHAEKMGGDGSAIYRPLGQINNAGLLRGMVEQCNSSLNFQMFPEEVTAVAAVLNREYYKFKD